MRLEDELMAAVRAAAAGQPVGDAMVRDMAMAARSVLARHGLPDARVEVRRSGGTTLTVEVVPPPRAPQVQRIVLRLG